LHDVSGGKVDSIKEFIGLLSTAGGWGVAGIACWALYRKDKACDAAHERTDALAERLRVAMTDNTVALNNVASVIDGVRDTIRAGASR
jgi:hypothetical protein